MSTWVGYRTYRSYMSYRFSGYNIILGHTVHRFHWAGFSGGTPLPLWGNRKLSTGTIGLSSKSIYSGIDGCNGKREVQGR